MAKAKKLPSGQWRAQGWYKDPATGKIDRPSFTAPTKAEAVRLCAEWQATRKRKTDTMTVEECLERYISSKEQALSPSTIRVYRVLQKHSFTPINKLPISTITSEDMQRFVSKLLIDKSPKTVRNIYTLLTSAIGMHSDTKFRVSIPPNKVIDRNIPTDAEIKQLISHSDGFMKIAIILAATGTLRAGEVCALTYGDIDGDTIHVHRDMVKTPQNTWVIKDHPKTSASDRYIPLPKNVIDLLGAGSPTDRVVPYVPTTIDSKFYVLKRSLGIKCRFHDLRHYAASLMHALNIPDQFIQLRGGWKSDRVLKSVYRHALDDQNKKYQAKANRHFSSLIS